MYSSYCGFFEPSHFIPLSRPLVPFFCALLTLSRPQHRRLKEWVRRKRKRHETTLKKRKSERTMMHPCILYILYICACRHKEREREREIFWGLRIAAEFIHAFLLKVIALIPERPTRIPQAVASVPVPIVMEAVVLMPVFLAVEKHPSISLRPKIAVLFCRTQASHPGGSFSLRMLKGKIEGSENQKDYMIQGFVNSNQLWYSKKTIYHVVSCDGIMNIWFLHFIVLEIVASKNVY